MTDIERLVSRQLHYVELRYQVEHPAEECPRVKVDDVHYGPCVLLSRECGSEGEEVARRVGEQLGWQVFNREIVEEVARRVNVRNQLVESVDEHVRRRWRAILHPLGERAGITAETYLYHLHEVVLTLGHHGKVVIIGRGAQFVLPAACALRVRIVDRFEARARRVAIARRLAITEADRWVMECDEGRTAFIRRFFHEENGAPLNYDLVLNTGDLGVDGAVRAVLAALESKLGVAAPAPACAM